MISDSSPHLKIMQQNVHDERIDADKLKRRLLHFLLYSVEP